MKKKIDELKEINENEKKNLEKKIEILTEEKEAYKKDCEELVQSKGKYSIYPIKPGEKVISINFVSMDKQEISNFSLVCKIQIYSFISQEERLYESYPQYKNEDTYFEANGIRIKRFKTLDENGIKNNDVINMFIIQ